MSTKHKAPQAEMNWGEPEGFALVPEKAVDWSTREAAANQVEQDRQASESKQATLLPGEQTQPGIDGTWHFWGVK